MAFFCFSDEIVLQTISPVLVIKQFSASAEARILQAKASYTTYFWILLAGRTLF